MKDEKIIMYLNNEMLAEEKIEFENWLKSSIENEKYFYKVKLLWKKAEFNYQNVEINSVDAWDKIESSISVNTPTVKRTRVLSISKLRRIAAVLIVLIGVGYLISITTQNLPENIEWTSVHTTDEKQNITLSDGTSLWLNINSEITYPNSFNGEKRKVILNGEAFFDVARNAKKPFIIHSNKSAIQVLGTSFNVESNIDMANVKVTVVTGKVALFDTTNIENKIILQPGEQGIHYYADNELVKINNSDKNFLAWKTGILVFENTTLNEVCQILSKHFDKQIVLQNKEALKEKSLTAIYENKSIDEILEILEITLDISIMRNENGITLLKN